MNTDSRFIKKFNEDNENNFKITLVEFFPETKLYQYKVEHEKLTKPLTFNLPKDYVRILVNDTFEMHLFKLKLEEQIGIHSN